MCYVCWRKEKKMKQKKTLAILLSVETVREYVSNIRIDLSHSCGRFSLIFVECPLVMSWILINYSNFQEDYTCHKLLLLIWSLPYTGALHLFHLRDASSGLIFGNFQILLASKKKQIIPRWTWTSLKSERFVSHQTSGLPQTPQHKLRYRRKYRERKRERDREKKNKTMSAAVGKTLIRFLC